MIGRIAHIVVRYSGLPFLFREVLFRRATRIILFHDPGVEEFDRALGYLSRRYNIIALEDHLSGRPLPPKPLVITFDDGHLRNHALMGLFRKYGIRPTIFLCSGLIGTNRRYWFLHAALTGSSEDLKTLPNGIRLQILEANGFTPEREFDTPQAMTREQVLELRPHVDFQAHTVFHPCLPTCTDEVAEREIAGSKVGLEALLSAPVTAFAFPNGDYCERDLDLVKQAGYACSLTVDYGFNRKGTDPYRLKRLSVDDGGNVHALSAKVSGAYTLLAAIFSYQRFSGFKRGPVRAASTVLAAQLALFV